MSSVLQKKLLNNFTHIEKIAQGGMGEIYRGFDKKNKREVAIKHFRTQNSHKEGEAKERLLREAQVTQKLNHPNIAGIHEIKDLDGDLIIIRPFYHGQTLEEKMHSDELSVTESLNIALQICSALELAHQKNIVHRDIKPENIFIQENGNVLLMDFGLAKATDLFSEVLTQTGYIVGTIAYIAPEGIKGLATNHQSDIWSLGVVLFEMLNSENPFGSSNDLSATMLNIITRSPILTKQDNLLNSIIHKALAKDVADRYQTISDLSSDLLAFASGESLKLEPISIIEHFDINKLTTKTNQVIRTNLDKPDKIFIGRENEIKLINYYLASPESRLITILGPGGSGKTTLAKQIAHHQSTLPQFFGGIYLVNLESITSKLGIPAALSTELTLSFTNQNSLEEQIISYLKDKHLLLIFDNTEHLKGDLDIVLDILKSCPYVKILCTSRLKLSFDQEWTMKLFGLTLPQKTDVYSLKDTENSSAVQLFKEKARQITPYFKLTPENINSVVKICDILQGSPLAIELATSWVRIFEPNRILEEIKSNLDFLSSSEDIGQQRSMRVVFNNSWDMLEPYQRLCLAKLAIFKGGFDFNAAKTICDFKDSHILHELIDAFLLQESSDDHFDLQPLIKQYVSEKLSSASSLHHLTSIKHSNYYFDNVLSASHHIRTKEQDIYLSQLAKNFENFKAAWFWLLKSNLTLDTSNLTSLAEVIKRFFLTKCRFTEGINFFTTSVQLIAHDQNYLELSSHLKAHLAGLKLNTNNRDNAYQLAREAFISLAQSKDFQGTMLPLSILGICEASNGNYTLAKKYFYQSVKVAEKYSDVDQATHMANLAIAEQCLGNYKQSETYNEKALKLARNFKLSSQELTLCNNLASLMLTTKQTIKAIMYLEDSLSLAEELNSKDIIPYIHCNLGNVYFQLQDYEQALQHYSEANEQAKENQQSNIKIEICAEIGQVYLAKKQLDLAKQYILESLDFSHQNQQIEHTFKALAYWSQYLIVKGDLITSATILVFVKTNDMAAQENIELVNKILCILSKYLTTLEMATATKKANSIHLKALVEKILKSYKYEEVPSKRIESSAMYNLL